MILEWSRTFTEGLQKHLGELYVPVHIVEEHEIGDEVLVRFPGIGEVQCRIDGRYRIRGAGFKALLREWIAHTKIQPGDQMRLQLSVPDAVLEVYTEGLHAPSQIDSN